MKRPEACAAVSGGEHPCHYTMLGNVRSVGLHGAAWMIDSDRTTHLLRICAGQGSPTSRSPKLVLNDHD
jgi:hypothetical protein